MVQYLYRSEQIIVKATNKDYKTLDEMTFRAKNLYNRALFEERQIFSKYQRFINEFELYKILHDTEAFKSLPSGVVINILHLLYNELKTFQKLNNSYNLYPSKYTGRPNLPKYKNKSRGRYVVHIRGKDIKKKFGYYILPGKLGDFRIKIPDRIKDKDLKYIKIVPKSQHIKLVMVYVDEYEVLPELKYTAGIDLGLDNLAAMAIYGPKISPVILNGKGLESYNSYFNFKVDYLRERAKSCNNKTTTKKIERLYNKRNNYINTWMHTASKWMVDYLVDNQVKNLVIGVNKGWKSNLNLGYKTNRRFKQIPHAKFIKMITYKAQAKGINVYHIEESYTSGTSFYDNEQPTRKYYDISRRVYRGLFKSNSGDLINADINAAFQIIKKVFPNANYSLEGHGIVGCDTHPLKLNI